MTNKNRDAGNRLEREIVTSAKVRGIPAVRAWASDGRSIGLRSNVDGLIMDMSFQAKKRKSLPSYIFSENPVVINREYAAVKLSWLLSMLERFGKPPYVYNGKLDFVERKVVSDTVVPDSNVCIQIVKMNRNEPIAIMRLSELLL